MAFGMVLAAQIGARISRKIPGKYLTAFGMFWASLVMFSFTAIDIKWGIYDIMIRLFFLAFGIGIGLPSLTTTATNCVDIHEVGIASSVLALARNVAGAYGIAIFATILTNSVTSIALDIQKFSFINSFDTSTLKQALPLVYIKAYMESFKRVFAGASLIMVVGGISALFIKNDSKNKNTKEIDANVEF